LCARTKRIGPWKTTWKFWSCHKNTQVINYYGNPLSCWKRGKGEIVEWPVNRCPLSKVRIGRGKGRTTEVELQSCVAFPVNAVAISTQSHSFPMYIYINIIIHLYINTQCMYKYSIYKNTYIVCIHIMVGTSHWKRYSSNMLYSPSSLKLITKKWRKVFKTLYNNYQIMLIVQYAMWFERKTKTFWSQWKQKVV